MATEPTFTITLKLSPELAAIRRAMDLMGLALAHHGHVWTDEERAAFDHAAAVIERLIEVA